MILHKPTHHSSKYHQYKNQIVMQNEIPKSSIHVVINKLNAEENDEFRLVSTAINHEGRLPRKYTTEGQGALKNISPPLEWYNVPSGTKTLAIVVEDMRTPEESDGTVPDSQWVVVNIPPTLKGLPEGFSGKDPAESFGHEFAGIKEGINDFKVRGWCAPVKITPGHLGHKLQFKLYALDDELHLGNKVTKEKLLDAIHGHVLGEAELVATF